MRLLSTSLTLCFLTGMALAPQSGMEGKVSAAASTGLVGPKGLPLPKWGADTEQQARMQAAMARDRGTGHFDFGSGSAFWDQYYRSCAAASSPNARICTNVSWGVSSHETRLVL